MSPRSPNNAYASGTSEESLVSRICGDLDQELQPAEEVQPQDPRRNDLTLLTHIRPTQPDILPSSDLLRDNDIQLPAPPANTPTIAYPVDSVAHGLHDRDPPIG